MSYVSDDDDLFEYDPDTEVTQTQAIPQSNTTDLSDREKDLIDNIKEHFDHTEGSIKGLEITLASAFYNALSTSTDAFNQSATLKSIKMTLDELTDGRYSLIEYFNTIESKIAHKIFFLNLCDAVFEGDQTYADIVKEIFDIELTNLHLQTVYYPTIQILRHTLELDKATYLQLSEQLNIPVKMCLFENNIEEFSIDDFVYKLFANKVNANITKDLVGIGLLEKVHEAFDKNVRFIQEES